VVAKTDVECYRLDKEQFNAILRSRPPIAQEISALLAERRVEIEAARGEIDGPETLRRIDLEKRRLLGTIQDFFGLRKDGASN
jgi:CRP-like cAMP-binding protein